MDVNGGYAEYMTVPMAFAHALPPALTDSEIAPLLCAGAIGYRSLQLAGLTDGQTLGLTGFGASAHLVLKLARHLFPSTRVFVFARRAEERAFAESLGADWAGDTDAAPPEPPAAIVDTTPAWKPVVHGLRHLAPGGRLVINALSKGDGDRQELARVTYASDLWMEKEVKTVANVTRQDVRSFLAVADRAGIKPEVAERPLSEANEALAAIAKGDIRGATVLRVAPEERAT
jgi:propanol-preferring alcohol dehydrogenase